MTLHEVAGGSLSNNDVLVPFARLLKCKVVCFRQSAITGIDLAAQQVNTSNGPLGYDMLVIAPGSETRFFGIPGLEEHSLEPKSVEDAWRM